MNIQSNNIDSFVRGCSEAERLRMFKKYCYDRRVLVDNPDADVSNKQKLTEMGTIFKKNGVQGLFLIITTRGV